MKDSLASFWLVFRSVSFTILLHGILAGLALAGLWWPFNEEQEIKRGSIDPIQAQVVSSVELEERAQAKQRKIEEQIRIEQEREALRLKKIAEQKRKEEEERQRVEEEKRQEEARQKQLEEQRVAEEKRKEEERLEAIRKEEEAKRKAEEEKKRKEEEAKKKKEEEERKRKEEEERKKKEEEERKRKEEEERKKKEEEERKRKEEEARKKKEEEEKRKKAEEKRKKMEEEKRRKEKELQERLEQERQAQELARTKSEAVTALSQIVDKIAAAVENNWRRPLNSSSGLIAVVQVKVSVSGDVISAKVVQGSGDALFDQSAEIAVKRASPLPFPADPKYHEYINVFNFKFNPDGI